MYKFEHSNYYYLNVNTNKKINFFTDEDDGGGTAEYGKVARDGHWV